MTQTREGPPLGKGGPVEISSFPGGNEDNHDKPPAPLCKRKFCASRRTRRDHGVSRSGFPLGGASSRSG